MHDDAPPREIDIATAEGNICINEDELPTVTDTELARFRLTREQLNQLFAAGMELMRGKTIRDRVRPVAAETLDGNWEVRIVRYSPLNDSLTKGVALWARGPNIERRRLRARPVRSPALTPHLHALPPPWGSGAPPLPRP